MPVIGVPAFNAVTLLRIEAVDFASKGAPLVGHGAFVNTSNGMTYGQTTCRNWTKKTLDKLAELRACMEEDLATLVFERGGATTPTGPALQQSEPGGIGEDLRGGGPDAPQI